MSHPIYILQKSLFIPLLFVLKWSYHLIYLKKKKKKADKAIYVLKKNEYIQWDWQDLCSREISARKWHKAATFFFRRQCCCWWVLRKWINDGLMNTSWIKPINPCFSTQSKTFDLLVCFSFNNLSAFAV